MYPVRIASQDRSRSSRAAHNVHGMNDGTATTAADNAIDALRGYADRDAFAVQRALGALDADTLRETYAVLTSLLSSTVSIMEVSDTSWRVGPIVRAADEAAAAAPPHYEFAIVEAIRAWACRDHTKQRAVSSHDLAGAVHATAVFVTVLGTELWGRDAFLDVLQQFSRTLAEAARKDLSGA